MSGGLDAVNESADRAAIWDCLVRCARGVDRLDRDLIRSAYHDDAVDDHGMFVGSRDEFIDWAIELHSRAHQSHQHYLSNHSCEIEGDDAYAETYFQFVGMDRPKAYRPAAISMSGGRYVDHLTRRDGEWRISSRLSLREWSVQHEGQQGGAVSAVASSLSPAALALMAQGVRPSRDDSDPSYLRPVLIGGDRLRAGAHARGRDSG